MGQGSDSESPRRVNPPCENMIGIAGFTALVVLITVGAEALRWTLRPEARRLRVIKKIGRSR